MEYISPYVSGHCFYCAICLKTSSEAKLFPNNNIDFFHIIQPYITSLWLCMWCTAELRLFQRLMMKAVQSQKWLDRINTQFILGNEASTLEELEQIKNISYTTVTHPVLECSSVNTNYDPESSTFDTMEHKASTIKSETGNLLDADDFDWEATESAVEYQNYSIFKKCELDSDYDHIQQNIDGEAISQQKQNLDCTNIKSTKSSRKARRKIKPQKAKSIKIESPRTSKRRPANLKTWDLNVETLDLTEEQVRQEHEASLIKSNYLHAPYKCERCAFGFHHRDTYDKHMRVHSASNGEYRCEVCDSYYAQIRRLQAHVKVHYCRYRCRICGFTTNVKQRQRNHYANIHLESHFLCVHCNMQFGESSQLEDHVKKEHNMEFDYKCKLCGKVFWEEFGMKAHMWSHKEDGVNRCPICDKVVKSKYYLDSHIQSHDFMTRICCPVCKKQFKDKYQQRDHYKRKHSDHSKYECDYCKKIFPSKFEISGHIRWVHLKQGIQCPQCSKMFRSQFPLQKHISLVHKQIPNPRTKLCDVCGKGFTTQGMLDKHYLTHTGERPFACIVCGKAFAQSSTMKTHYKLVHLKIKRNQNKNY